ncbi:ankyrin repeat-containing protein BDA1-like [Magnolia sinica]|uniref:ankyrin repeat-containing protein BDA1-like n=1 Tax=Magnolia sinica TaxID=86752 RepID=UPI0026591E57|nr:ankyrin repeat-containing protein BDA1-like [Magnolia sinica]
MDSRLQKAAVMGDVKSLHELLVQYDCILDSGITGVDDAKTPLHVAALYGHAEFAREILRHRPGFASRLDSKGFSPLHLASAKGHLEMVKVLLEINSSMCLVSNRDGRIPIHTAAMNGRVDVLKELVRDRLFSTRVFTESGETALHLCVKHKRLDALKALVDELNGDATVLNMKDDEDNTILHLATATRQIPMVEYLVKNNQVNLDALNMNGLTALDVLLKSPCEPNDEELETILVERGAGSANRMDPAARMWQTDDSSWLDEARKSLMVAAVLIATATFHATLNPPGGLWPDTTFGRKVITKGHFARESTLSDRVPGIYAVFITSNGIGFVASLLVILLLISGLSLRRRFLMLVLTVVMRVAVFSMGFTYLLLLIVLQPFNARLPVLIIIAFIGIGLSSLGVPRCIMHFVLRCSEILFGILSRNACLRSLFRLMHP